MSKSAAYGLKSKSSEIVDLRKLLEKHLQPDKMEQESLGKYVNKFYDIDKERFVKDYGDSICTNMKWMAKSLSGLEYEEEIDEEWERFEDELAEKQLLEYYERHGIDINSRIRDVSRN